MEIIPRKTISNLIASTGLAAREPSSLLRAMDETEVKILLNHERVYRGVPRQKAMQRIAREQAFKNTLLEQPVAGVDVQNPIAERLKQSSYIDLYWLFVADGLKTLIKRNRSKLTLDDRVTCVQEYLALNRRKNNEEGLARYTAAITVGFEVEHYPHLSRILNKLYHKSIFGQQLESHSEGIRKRSRALLGEVSIDDAFDSLGEYDPVASTIGAITNYNVVNELSGAELKTAASASPRTQLRELMQIGRSGGLEGYWGIHETVTGIFLDKDHTEVMDILPLSIAAGFVDVKHLSLGKKTHIRRNIAKYQRGEKRDSSLSREKHAKRSDISHQEFYFPYHRVRKAYKIDPYLSPLEANQAVELRSTPPYQVGHFSKFVRKATFTYLAAWGIRDVQSRNRTGANRTLLADAWIHLQDEWEALLTEKDLYGNRGTIHNPTNAERFIQLQDPYSEPKKGTTEYEHFIDRMKLESQINPVFRRRARAIIAEYNKTARAVIEY